MAEAVGHRWSVKKGVLRNCLRPSTLLKKRLWHRCFPVNFVKFLRTPFYIELMAASKMGTQLQNNRKEATFKILELYFQKQSPRVVLQKRRSEKFLKIHWKTPAPKSFFK